MLAFSGWNVVQILVGQLIDFDRREALSCRSGTLVSREGFSMSLQRWIESLEFDACLDRAKLPVDLPVVLMAFGLPGGDHSA